jgi:hypothetical protein
MAAVRQRRYADADKHLQALHAAAADPVIEKMLVWDRYPLSYAVQVADLTVTGNLPSRADRTKPRLRPCARPAAIEDQIPYDEPPAWHAPVRQAWAPRC